MSVSSAQCRRHAAYCRKLASRKTFFFPSCEAFLDLARKWEELADELDQTQAIIDNWRHDRFELRTRPEAVRRLIMDTLKAKDGKG